MKVCPVCRAQFPPGANFCPDDGHALEESDERPGSEEDGFLGALLDERYRVEDKLGEGGMGVVYAARHEVIDKPVAVKILRHEYCKDKGLVQRFIREARAASRIGHPNIVDVTDFGKLKDGHIYFVMEYLVGTTLGHVLRAHKGLPLPRVMDLSVQMCHGLAAAHAKGIVHRDLKPENIFIVNPVEEGVGGVDETGKRRDFVKLLDFGIAKFNFGQKTRLTRMGSIFGTPQYMSPEQAAGEDADHRGDIYSLGCILYEMVTGQAPFVADTFMGTLTKHMFEAPMRPCRMRPELKIPEPVEQVILKMLAKEPSSRYESTTEVAAALRETIPTIEGADALLVPDDMMETFPPGPTSLDLRASSDRHAVSLTALEFELGQDDEVLLLEQPKRPRADLSRELDISQPDEHVETAPAPIHARWPLWGLAGLAVFLLGAGVVFLFLRGGAVAEGAGDGGPAAVDGAREKDSAAVTKATTDAGSGTVATALGKADAAPPSDGAVPSVRKIHRAVVVDSVPGGALVGIGGRWTDRRTPVKIPIPNGGRGKVRVKLFKQGFRIEQRTITGKRGRVKIRLRVGRHSGSELRTPQSTTP